MLKSTPTMLKRKDAPTILKRECPDVQMSTLLKRKQKKREPVTLIR